MSEKRKVLLVLNDGVDLEAVKQHGLILAVGSAHETFTAAQLWQSALASVLGDREMAAGECRKAAARLLAAIPEDLTEVPTCSTRVARG